MEELGFWGCCGVDLMGRGEGFLGGLEEGVEDEEELERLE